MFQTITPEQAGISSLQVEKFLRALENRGLATHSVLLMRGQNIFVEYYWKPFHKDQCHRMYSQTKSFVSIACGLLEQDGKLNLDDPICRYFPDKCPEKMPENLRHLTVRQMLTMETCGETPFWFTHPDPDRVHLYFRENPAAIPGGMRWEYDSPGSMVLSALVERLSGMSLLEFLRKRIFQKLGTFQTASILKTKTEDSFGDSAMLCTTRDMASFARFVMNYGRWGDEQILNEAYIRTATTAQVDNDKTGFAGIWSLGYGYQIWCLGEDAFFFYGMGGQLTLCLPKKDLIFVITSDNQGYQEAESLIVAAFFDHIVDFLQDEPLTENACAYESLCQYGKNLRLYALAGRTESPYAKTLHGKTYDCQENPTGITEFTFLFPEADRGELHYVNAQGKKCIYFGLGKNVFGSFPQLGYSHTHAGAVTTDGFQYQCAVSAAWREEQKLLIKVQIIDEYLGNAIMIFSFRENHAVVRMLKTAENFLEEYSGCFTASCRDS